jgi:uncharacterized linocin/CFP29 family protein
LFHFRAKRMDQCFDVSIGYLSHTDSVVRLYPQETLTFLMLTSEGAVAFGPPATKSTA